MTPCSRSAASRLVQFLVVAAFLLKTHSAFAAVPHRKPSAASHWRLRLEDTPTRGVMAPLQELRRSPRAQSTVWMTFAMAFHFGGYEFFRNACLALFTSREYGFLSPTAFPLATALISPFTVLLLWAYTRQLEAVGPRLTLRDTTLASILYIGLASALLSVSSPRPLKQALMGLTYLVQSSYQYLLYSQQWSFVSSVVTPDEGSRWFSTMSGCSSLLTTAMGLLVPFLLPHLGLLGLMAATCLTLTVTLYAQDAAYDLSERHGFNPGNQTEEVAETVKNGKPGRIQTAVNLFRRVPTLRALMVEVVFWQSLNAILNVAFVSALSREIPDNLARSAFSGRFYAMVSAASAVLQFAVLPIVMNFAEPKYMWRTIPLIPLSVCLVQALHAPSVELIAVAFFCAKVMDYSIRSVVYSMVYQHLDYESRFVGKEIIGVLGSRFGKSGMSLVLSGLAAVVSNAQPMLVSHSLTFGFSFSHLNTPRKTTKAER